MTTDRNKELLEVVLDNLKTVLDSSLEAIQSGYEETGKFRAVSPLKRSSVEIYDIEVFRSASALESAIYRLRQNITYIENYTGDIDGHDTVLTQYDWIQYHYSFFVTTLVSIPDLLFILVNAIFELGNPERHCKRDIILKNAWIRETEIPRKIHDLESIVKPYRKPRNLLIHRGRMPDLPCNSDNSLLDYLSFYNVPLKARSDFMSPELLRAAWEHERPKIRVCLLSEAERIDASVTSVFDALLPYYLTVRGKHLKEGGT